ncbi:hypothetical protein ACQKMD_17275 [Viridibacillus sp. NPDC096237]|uniref:hypothetical protein n=1 Tax=Viridibacillus sp. NPDC096237 TaxID=3390721 RepID=UPI003D068BA3
MFKNKHNKKKFGVFTAILLSLVLIAGILAFYFNIYPGGYSIKENSEEVTVLKNNFLKNGEKLTFTVSEENELKLTLLKNEVNQLISMWLVSLLGISSLLIVLVNNVQRKGNYVFIIASVLIVILIPLVIYVYNSNLYNIEQLIKDLRI